MLFIIVLFCGFYSSTICPAKHNSLIMYCLYTANFCQSNLILKITTSGEFPVRTGGPHDPNPEET